jgi:HK97 family phage major capsid protein
MAITAATQLSDFSGFLTPEMSAPIFDDAAKVSAAMRLFQQVPLGPNGKAIPITLTKPSATWTGEAAEKGKTEGSMDLLTMEPKKLTAICVMSAEVVRANPGGYSTALRGQFAEAFASAFDAAVFHGTSTPFAASLSDTTNTVEFGTGATIYTDIVSGLTSLVADGKKLNKFAFGPTAEPVLLGAVDDNKRPLLTPSAADGVYASIIGRPMVLADGVNKAETLGFGGDFSKGAWGVVGGINYNVSTEATVTINGQLVSLWEKNLVAVLAEAEYGFVLADADHFVAFTDTPAS